MEDKHPVWMMLYRVICNVSIDEWNIHRCLALVLNVRLAKEAHQELLLLLDAVGEEGVQGDGEAHDPQWVHQHELGAHSPPEEAEVGRVSYILVDPVSYQLVVRLSLGLHQVVEGTACCFHRQRPHRLAHDHQRKANNLGQTVPPFEVREHRVLYGELDQRNGVGKRVRGPVVDDERLRVDPCGVVPGGYPELEEMEERQRHQVYRARLELNKEHRGTAKAKHDA